MDTYVEGKIQQGWKGCSDEAMQPVYLIRTVCVEMQLFEQQVRAEMETHRSPISAVTW